MGLNKKGRKDILSQSRLNSATGNDFTDLCDQITQALKQGDSKSIKEKVSALIAYYKSDYAPHLWSHRTKSV
jgi:hypothetical protein